MVLLKGAWAGRVSSSTPTSTAARASELAANPHGALLFHWKSLRRQVRVEGPVEPVGDAEADAYFASRSRDSQLGAWASDQSRPLDSRATFEQRYEEMAARFEGEPVPRPPRWCGFPADARAHRVLERPAAPAARAPAVHPGTASGWSEGLLYP